MQEILGVPLHFKNLIDKIVEESSHSQEKYPVSDRDWNLVVTIYELWKNFFPTHYQEFLESAKIFKNEHVLNKGIVREGQTILQHKLEIPEMLYTMIKKVFPEFRFTEKNAKKFVSLLPEFGSKS